MEDTSLFINNVKQRILNKFYLDSDDIRYIRYAESDLTHFCDIYNELQSENARLTKALNDYTQSITMLQAENAQHKQLLEVYKEFTRRVNMDYMECDKMFIHIGDIKQEINKIERTKK